LTFGLSAQEGPRPELSKKEVRQYHRKLKKLNKSLQKKTSKLRRFLEEQGVNVPSTDVNLPPDSLAMPELQFPDSLKGNFQDYQQKLKGKIPSKDALPLPSAQEAKRQMKQKLNVDGKTAELSSQVAQRKGQLDQLKGR